MPQYNGPFSFVVEVLAHLLRNYLAWMFVFAVVIPAPFVIWTTIAVGFEEAVRPWLTLMFVSMSFWFSAAHWMTFLALPYYFPPRFPYAPLLVTYAIAACTGTVLLGANWTWIGGTWAGDALLNRFAWAGIATIGASALGAMLMKLGGTGLLHWDLGRWFGWLVVGRRAFEAFLAEDAVRLKQAFDQYEQSFRKRSA